MNLSCVSAAGGPGSVQGVEGSSGLHQGLTMGEFSWRVRGSVPPTQTNLKRLSNCGTSMPLEPLDIFDRAEHKI